MFREQNTKHWNSIYRHEHERGTVNSIRRKINYPLPKRKLTFLIISSSPWQPPTPTRTSHTVGRVDVSRTRKLFYILSMILTIYLLPAGGDWLVVFISLPRRRCMPESSKLPCNTRKHVRFGATVPKPVVWSWKGSGFVFHWLFAPLSSEPTTAGCRCYKLCKPWFS